MEILLLYAKKYTAPAVPMQCKPGKLLICLAPVSDLLRKSETRAC